MKNIRSGQPAHEGVDQRTGVEHAKETSSTPTFTTQSRAGIRLNGVPNSLLADHAGTLTRAQYMEWRYGE
jgi:hypothetical protein